MEGKKPIQGNRITDEVFEAICDDIATSDIGLVNLCKRHGVSSRQFLRHVADSPEKRQIYERARDEQADFLADQILEIADDGSKDTITITDPVTGKTREIEDKEWTARSKLRVDARKFIAAKLKPKKYGDRIEVDGTLDQTITVSFRKPKEGEH